LFHLKKNAQEKRTNNKIRRKQNLFLFSPAYLFTIKSSSTVFFPSLSLELLLAFFPNLFCCGSALKRKDPLEGRQLMSI